MAEYTFENFRNESGLRFVNISSELFRVYRYPGGEELVIQEPVALSISKSGGHRIFDAEGYCHYITSGWRQISWRVKQGHPHFVK